MIKTIIFDYDGVIVDSFSTVFEIYQKMCKEFGIRCPRSLERFREIYGYSMKEARQNLGIDINKYERAEEIFKEEILKKNPKIFDGISEVLSKLSKKYQLFLITANFREEAVQKVKRHNIFKYFTKIFGHDSKKGFLKREAIRHIIERYKFKKDEVLYIGDRNVDYDIAQEAGLNHVLLVDYGWGYDKNKIKQDVVIKKPVDILKAVEGVALEKR